MMISSPHMLRRFCCFTTVVASSSSSNTQKKRLVFMGSPQVSASVLDNLLTASSAPESIFEINPEESWLSFEENATVLHNKVRAFAGWPGIDREGNHRNNITELKIITTRVLDSKQVPSGEIDDDIYFSKGSLIFRCGEGTALEESGRAGRDGLPSECLLYFRPADVPTSALRFFILQLMYHSTGRESLVEPRVGSWNMIDKKMVNGARVNFWTCISFSRLNINIDRFCNELISMCCSKEMEFNQDVYSETKILK